MPPLGCINVVDATPDEITEYHDMFPKMWNNNTTKSVCLGGFRGLRRSVGLWNRGSVELFV